MPNGRWMSKSSMRNSSTLALIVENSPRSIWIR
jgi:hypothetical protein